MKILILGARGMLGHELAKAFDDPKFEVILWDREELDITDAAAVEEKLTEIQPEVVINAAAYTAVDQAEGEPELVYKINSAAVENLAQTCKKLGVTLIHFSTDYVFDGKNAEGYREDEKQRAPQSVYGESKKRAEENLERIEPNYYLVRTQWLFGKDGKNFVETMLRLAGEGKSLKVVNDQFGSPTYAKDLAEKVRELVETQPAFGIYHLTNSGSCNWFEFACKIFERAGVAAEIAPVPSSEFPTPAKRPTYSMLINTKVSPLRSWEEALEAYLQETGRLV